MCNQTGEKFFGGEEISEQEYELVSFRRTSMLV